MGNVFSEFERGQIEHPKSEDGEIAGRILYFDRFGNAITNISRNLIQAVKIQIQIKDLIIVGLQNAYTDVTSDSALAYFGSSQTLEIAVSHGNAQDTYNLKAGDPVLVRLDG